MSVLVTGGAGYIGSHAVYALTDRNESVVVIDNLSTGFQRLVSEKAVFVKGDISDERLVRNVLQQHGIDEVMHFAASTVVPDSVADPLAYYRNNTSACCIFLNTCVQSGVRKFIFSSTAAVYGTGIDKPIAEDAPLLPISPYGRSKLMVEQMLEDAAHAGVVDYIALRYFNVAGADPQGRTGQSTPRATHLIKRACQAALGCTETLEVFGTDYPTPDGTGIRDYIHVTDLADAHRLVLNALRSGTASGVFNVGYGRGTSVREAILVVEEVTGGTLPTHNSPRRAGDPAVVVADPARIRDQLGWTPQHDDLAEIVRSAFAWECRQSQEAVAEHPRLRVSGASSA